MKTQIIVEKRIGIPPDYQYRALRGKNFLKSNWHSNKLYLLRAYVGFSKKYRVLDLGTGSGNFELEFANNVRQIIGIDYNDEAIKFLKGKLKDRKIRNVKLICKDIRSLKKIKKLGKFDVIVASDVIEHIKIKEAKVLVKSIKTLLKPDGRVFIITPNYKSFWIAIEYFADLFSFLPRLLGKQHLAKYYKENLNKLFRIENLTNVSFHSFNLFSYLFPNKNLSARLSFFETKLPIPIGNLILGIYKLNH